MVDLNPPVENTPFSQNGHSLQVNQLTCMQGLASNLGTMQRTVDEAPALNNFQMLVRGIWTSQGLGWQRHRPTFFNNGGEFKDFSYFLDNQKNKTLLFQVGGSLYSYNLATATETLISNALNATALPTMRRIFSTISGASGVMYCNGVQQPQKITAITAGAITPANFNITIPPTSLSPPALTRTGTTGTAKYSYVVLATLADGVTQVYTPVGTQFTGAATLTGANFNTLVWQPILGATKYQIYRTAVTGGSPTTTGIIGTVTPVVTTTTSASPAGTTSTTTTTTTVTASPSSQTVTTVTVAPGTTTTTVAVNTTTFNDTGLAGGGQAAPSGANTSPVTINGLWGQQPFNGKIYNKPLFCEPFGNTFAFFGFPDPSTSSDVLISDFGDPESFTQSSPQQTTDAVVFTVKPDLGYPTAMKAFRTTNQSIAEILLLGTSDGITVISGSDASTFTMDVLTDEVGILSNRSFVKVGNDCIYLSTSGFRMFSTLASDNTLIADTLSSGLQDLINLIDPAMAFKAHAVHHKSTQEIQFWVPLVGDGGKCSHGFVLNYNNPGSGNGAISPVWSTRDGTSVSCSIDFMGTMYGGGYGAGTGVSTDGLLQQHYQSNLYDTIPMKFYMRTAIAYIGDPQQKESMRNIEIICDGGNQAFSMNAYVYQRMADNSFRKSQAAPAGWRMTASEGPETILGGWQLGLAAFPGNGVKTIPYQPQDNGQLWEFEMYSATATDALDYVATSYTLSGGSLQR